jgi:hypothetical protein
MEDVMEESRARMLAEHVAERPNDTSDDEGQARSGPAPCNRLPDRSGS